ncbi:MAG: hypothetical protein JWO80_4450, partial [Bryobacterales bacterium]|nr:hypothetical protein [Bryobacterales bacterium]
RKDKVTPAAYGFAALFWVAMLTGLASAVAIWFFYSNGSLMFFGDAEAHLNIARRIVDSRTPGYREFGTVWLPLPHALMLPFVGDMRLWRSGLAGAIPSAACFVIAACFLFAAARRIFAGDGPAAVATALFVCNPNALYLQSTAMTEPVFFACLFGLLYCTVAFQETQLWRYIAGAGVMAALGALTRYEGWLLMPFCAVFFFIAARARRWQAALLFSILAGLGPVLWIAYNWWVFDNPLEFFNGPGSPKDIQAGKPYPGLGDWMVALKYYGTAAKLCLGTPLFWVGLAGVLACFRKLWPLLLLSLPPLFYIWSMHSSGGTPIHVPLLPPNSWYNTRYGLALLPLAALTGAAIVALMPKGVQFAAAGLVLLACAGQWLLFPRPESWITWKEAQVNSESRRAWTEETVNYLAQHYKPRQTILSSSGDMNGVYRRLGIPLRNVLNVDNGPLYLATRARPDLFLWERWAVTFTGDPVQTAVDNARLRGPKYELAKEIIVKGGPVIQIYPRPDSAPNMFR